MEQLQNLRYEELIELLMAYTKKYTQHISDREMQSGNFQQCRLMVKAILEEIDKRDHPAKKDDAFLKP